MVNADSVLLMCAGGRDSTSTTTPVKTAVKSDGVYLELQAVKLGRNGPEEESTAQYHYKLY